MMTIITRTPPNDAPIIAALDDPPPLLLATAEEIHRNYIIDTC